MAIRPRTLKTKHAKHKADEPTRSGKMSPAKLKRSRRAAELQIDKFMKRVGYADPSERTDNQGWRWFDYGSAKGRVGIVDSGGDLFLRAESIVMTLPLEQDAILMLMRQLLEANMNIASSARLGISGESVFVCATVPVVELAPGNIPSHIHSAMALAASFVHEFAEPMVQEAAGREDVPAESLMYEGVSQGDVAYDPIPDPNPQAA